MTDYIDLAMLRPMLPERPKEGHKGTFGHVFIIAGSRGFTGASKLACEAASRSGVGLVTAGVPEPLGDMIGASLLEAMSFLLPATETESLSKAAVDPALVFAEDKTGVVLGPGLSQQTETQAFVLEFVPRCSAPLMIDADGINCLSQDPAKLDERTAPTVVTPHPGEMARLIGSSAKEVQKDREGAAKRFANDHRCVVVLKGYRTVVAGPDGALYVNPTGNAGLASGGTGDVLSGLIGGLMAQGMTGMDAALLGVYLHGLAGDIAANTQTERGMIARDVIAAIPEAWKTIEQGT